MMKIARSSVGHRKAGEGVRLLVKQVCASVSRCNRSERIGKGIRRQQSEDTVQKNDNSMMATWMGVELIVWRMYF